MLLILKIMLYWFLMKVHFLNRETTFEREITCLADSALEKSFHKSYIRSSLKIKIQKNIRKTNSIRIHQIESHQ